MKIEIWSDVACPFCYMGSHRLKQALLQIEIDEAIEIEWKSFQLNPQLHTDTSINIYQYLSREKEVDEDILRTQMARIASMGKSMGLNYQFDKVVVANTLKALQLIKAAAYQQLQNEVEEKLFVAYFSEGRNMDDIPTLMDIATAAGMNTEGLAEKLESNAYTDEVKADIAEAKELYIDSVPHFVIDEEHDIIGAQESSVFVNVIKEAYEERTGKKAVVKKSKTCFSYQR